MSREPSFLEKNGCVSVVEYFFNNFSMMILMCVQKKWQMYAQFLGVRTKSATARLF
jgi:hypothetical protein